MTLNEIIVDMLPEPMGVTSWLFDARTGIGFSYINRTAAGVYGAGTGTTYVNGVQQASNSNLGITDSVRQTIRTVFGSAAADDVNIFSANNELSFGKGRLYAVTIKNAGVIVGQYDMSTGTVQDQSGNGRHATLTGGTWADDAPTGTAYKASLSDAIATSDSLSKRLSVAIIDVVNTSETESERAAKVLADMLTTSDSFASTRGKAISVNDSIAITDTIRKALTIVKTDAINTAETERESTTRKLTDFLTPSDAIILTGGKAVLLADSFTMTDTVKKTLSKHVAESLGIADSAHRNVSARLYDVVVTTETFSKQLPNAPTIIGTIALKGSRDLNVYLLGSRVLDVTLRGEL